MAADVAPAASISRMSISDDRRPSSSRNSSSTSPDGSFVDADSFANASLQLKDDEDDVVKPSTALEQSPRSSSASEATHSGMSAETALTAESFASRDKRASLSSQHTSSTIDDIPLDDVDLDEVATSPNLTLDPSQPDTPTQPIASSSSSSLKSPPIATSPLADRTASWRRSASPLSPVSLSASSLNGVDEPDHGSVDGTVGTSHVGRRMTQQSVASTSSGNNNFDFLLQVRPTPFSCLGGCERAVHRGSTRRMHCSTRTPKRNGGVCKARISSGGASSGCIMSSLRMKGSLTGVRVLILEYIVPVVIRERTDFWGAVMSDYEKVAREQRAWLCTRSRLRNRC